MRPTCTPSSKPQMPSAFSPALTSRISRPPIPCGWPFRKGGKSFPTLPPRSAANAVAMSPLIFSLSRFRPPFDVPDCLLRRPLARGHRFLDGHPLAPHPETPAAHQPAGELTIPLGLYCRQSLASTWTPIPSLKKPKRASTTLPATSASPYPFGKYDQVFCPEYNMGAMENAGCVTLRDEYMFSALRPPGT